jgi:S1-C subfamily serine protease
MEHTLVSLSTGLAEAVDAAGRSVVTVHGRPRHTSSGVHWRPGVVVTAEHTLRRDEELSVTLPDGRNVPATLAGRDAGSDIAVLRIDAQELPVAAVTSDAASVRPGHLALTIGRSADSGVNATMGIFSAVSGPWRTWRGGQLDQYIRLDLTLYPGSSGGAVVDTGGKVIGIATSALSRIAGLAVPAATVERVMKDLLTKGRVARGFLGLGLQPVELPASLVKALNLSTSSGVIALSVEPGGPAEKAGAVIGDILMALNGKPVRVTEDVQAALGPDSVGKVVEAVLVRGGAEARLSITVGERPGGGK